MRESGGLREEVVQQQEGLSAHRDQNFRKALRELTSRHRANNAEAWRSLGLTVSMWVGAMTALHLSGGHWAAVTFLGLVQIRCFIVFHDVAHMAFFEEPESNRSLAQLLQYFVNYSYEGWDAVHNPHHTHFGDDSVRDASATVFFSEEELAKGHWAVRWAHRIIRDPLIFFPLAGFFVFFLNKPRVHGLYRLVVPLLVWATLGSQTAVAYVLASWVAATLGVAVFHLQHHCNSPYRVRDSARRTHLDAALLGSTRIPVPFPLSLFSYGIEYHHIHHYDSRVPGYRLPQCDREGAALGLWKSVNTVTAVRAFKSLFHTQFQGGRKFEEGGASPRFVSFWPYSALGLQDA